MSTSHPAKARSHSKKHSTLAPYLDAVEEGLSACNTQKHIAALLGLSPGTVSDLVRKEGFPKQSSLVVKVQWILNFYRSRKVAINQGDDLPENAYDPGQERARKDRIQADQAELNLLLTKGELVKRKEVVALIQTLASEMATRCDALIPLIQRNHPDIGFEALDTLDEEIRKFRNSFADMKLR